MVNGPQIGSLGGSGTLQGRIFVLSLVAGGRDMRLKKRKKGPIAAVQQPTRCGSPHINLMYGPYFVLMPNVSCFLCRQRRTCTFSQINSRMNDFACERADCFVFDVTLLELFETRLALNFRQNRGASQLGWLHLFPAPPPRPALLCKAHSHRASFWLLGKVSGPLVGMWYQVGQLSVSHSQKRVLVRPQFLDSYIGR
jgi:hypothetical protein